MKEKSKIQTKIQIFTCSSFDELSKLLLLDGLLFCIESVCDSEDDDVEDEAVEESLILSNVETDRCYYKLYFYS